MSDVKLICDKSFSEVDQEVVDCFIEFQQALIDNDSDRLKVDAIIDWNVSRFNDELNEEEQVAAKSAMKNSTSFLQTLLMH